MFHKSFFKKEEIMNIQNSTYYSIQTDQNDLIFTRQNTKPFLKKSAHYTLDTLHEILITRQLPFKDIKASEIKKIANDILNGYEYKMGLAGRFWDNIQQLFGYITERKQLTTFRDRIIECLDAKKQLPPISKLLDIHQQFSELEEEMQRQAIEFPPYLQEKTTPLAEIKSTIQSLQMGDLDNYFKIVSSLINHFILAMNSFFLTRVELDQILRSNFQTKINELHSFLYPLCMRMGKHYLKADQLDDAFTAYQLLTLRDNLKQVKACFSLVDKYLDKNKPDQAFAVAFFLAWALSSQEAQETQNALKKIQTSYLSNNLEDKTKLLRQD